MVAEGEIMELLEDVKSSSKRNVFYGKKGESVKVISVASYPVLLVETKRGRFSVQEENVCKAIINETIKK